MRKDTNKRVQHYVHECVPALETWWGSEAGSWFHDDSGSNTGAVVEPEVCSVAATLGEIDIASERLIEGRDCQ